MGSLESSFDGLNDGKPEGSVIGYGDPLEIPERTGAEIKLGIYYGKVIRTTLIAEYVFEVERS